MFFCKKICIKNVFFYGYVYVLLQKYIHVYQFIFSKKHKILGFFEKNSIFKNPPFFWIRDRFLNSTFTYNPKCKKWTKI